MKVCQVFFVGNGKGALSILNDATYRKFASSCEAGTEWEATIRPKRKRQGSQTMRYYRGVVIPDIATAAGYEDPDDYADVHESLAWKFLKIEDHPQLGYPRRRSTCKDDLTAEEITAYVTDCITWAETNIPGCRVRRPNEIEDYDGLPMVWQPDDAREVA